MRRLIASALLIVVSTSGCVTRTQTPYPTAWAVPQPASSDCPRLEGLYANEGSLAPGTDDSICHHEKGRWRLSWLCDVALARNIADSESGDWVELRQPDADTLVVVSSDPRVDVKTLHRSGGDFSCDSGGLRRRQHTNTLSLGGDEAHAPPAESVISGIGSALYGMFASGGVRTLTRTFTPALDGSLVMSVSVNESELSLALPSHTVKETYVRWQRVHPDRAGPDGSAATPGLVVEGASSSTVILAPSQQIARFQPRRQLASSASLSAVDGQSAIDNADLSTPYPPPQVLSPGRRWVEISVHSGTMIPIRDLYATYGFVLDAVAGHTYSLASQPEVCAAAGRARGADSPMMIFRKTLTVIDSVMDRELGRNTVNALCASEPVARCKRTDVRPLGLEGESCITLDEAETGFWGVEASGK